MVPSNHSHTSVVRCSHLCNLLDLLAGSRLGLVVALQRGHVVIVLVVAALALALEAFHAGEATSALGSTELAEVNAAETALAAAAHGVHLRHVVLIIRGLVLLILVDTLQKVSKLFEL